MKESVIRRLAFIRYLYTIGLEQSRQPEPHSAISILTFHDSIELFLQLSCEFLDVKTKANQDFMEYWDLLEPKLKTQLSQKESMRRLNRARVGLKHQGIIPYGETAGFRENVTSFFQENIPLVFEGTTFEQISMVDLVQCDTARETLKDAMKLMQNMSFQDALTPIALGFAELIDDYESRKRTTYGRFPFFFGESFVFESGSSLGLTGPFQSLGAFVDKVKTSISALQDAMKILSLGIDYRQYSRFRLYAPVVIRIIGGTYQVQSIMQEAVNEEECRFCFDFVIDSAIKLQESDYQVTEDIENAASA